MHSTDERLTLCSDCQCEETVLQQLLDKAEAEAGNAAYPATNGARQ